MRLATNQARRRRRRDASYRAQELDQLFDYLWRGRGGRYDFDAWRPLRRVEPVHTAEALGPPDELREVVDRERRRVGDDNGILRGGGRTGVQDLFNPMSSGTASKTRSTSPTAPATSSAVSTASTLPTAPSANSPASACPFVRLTSRPSPPWSVQGSRR